MFFLYLIRVIALIEGDMMETTFTLYLPNEIWWHTLSYAEYTDLAQTGRFVNKQWHAISHELLKNACPIEGIENLLDRKVYGLALTKIRLLQKDPHWMDLFEKKIISTRSLTTFYLFSLLRKDDGKGKIYFFLDDFKCASWLKKINFRSFKKINEFIEKLIPKKLAIVPDELVPCQNFLIRLHKKSHTVAWNTLQCTHPHTCFFRLIDKLQDQLEEFEFEILQDAYPEVFGLLTHKENIEWNPKSHVVELSKKLEKHIFNDIDLFSMQIYKAYVCKKAYEFANTAHQMGIGGSQATYFKYYCNLGLILTNSQIAMSELKEITPLSSFDSELQKLSFSQDDGLKKIQSLLSDPFLQKIFREIPDTDFELEIFNTLLKPQNILMKVWIYMKSFLIQFEDKTSQIAAVIHKLQDLLKKRILKIYIIPDHEVLKKGTQLLQKIHLQVTPIITFKEDKMRNYFHSMASLPNSFFKIEKLINLNLERKIPYHFWGAGTFIDKDLTSH